MKKALLLLAFIFISACGDDSGRAQPPLPTAKLTHLRSDGSEQLFTVELALTEEQQRIGLMHRTRMAQDSGMLFYFENNDVSMWMKNTLLPLDMIFMNRNGVVVDIIRNTRPLSEDILTPRVPANVVLELNAGTAERTRIMIGDIMRVEGQLPAAR